MENQLTKKIILASANTGKLTEFNTLFQNSGITVLSQGDFNVSSVAETGLTFVENALIKARHASEQTGLPAIADDSGLCVDALNGAPGIYSARYAAKPGETHADPMACNQKLLADLATAKKTTHANIRSARFYCVLVYLTHSADPTPSIAQGIWEGIILDQPQGSGGFGYDPVFYDPVLGRSAAQLSQVEKNRVSHRGQAMRQLLAMIK